MKNNETIKIDQNFGKKTIKYSQFGHIIFELIILMFHPYIALVVFRQILLIGHASYSFHMDLKHN